jgi:AmmeMemoRadiSam system protein A
MNDRSKLSEEEGKALLKAARRAIQGVLQEKKEDDKEGEAISPQFSEKRGTFVTLTIDGRLRGCIGHLTPQESLIEGVKMNAIQAAFQDPRFKPLSRDEFDKVSVEVSILTEPRPLLYSDGADLKNKLRPGIDGVIIKKGYRQATFLPQVWGQLPDTESFLTHLCMKAGLDGDAWKDEELQVLIYQVQAFEEERQAC